MADEMINPCPFCGSDNAEVHDPHGQSSLPAEWYWVVCLTCQAEGPPDLGKSGAIAAWNGAARWVSVEEDMPKAGKKVFTVAGDWIRIMQHGGRTGSFEVAGWWTIHHISGKPHSNANITHWQPLPPVPE